MIVSAVFVRVRFMESHHGIDEYKISWHFLQSEGLETIQRLGEMFEDETWFHPCGIYMRRPFQRLMCQYICSANEDNTVGR